MYCNNFSCGSALTNYFSLLERKHPPAAMSVYLDLNLQGMFVNSSYQ